MEPLSKYGENEEGGVENGFCVPYLDIQVLLIDTGNIRRECWGKRITG